MTAKDEALAQRDEALGEIAKFDEARKIPEIKISVLESDLKKCRERLQHAWATADSTEDKRIVLEAENAKMRGWAKEALEDIQSWGEYASEYFKQKWNFEGDVKKWQDRIPGK